MGVFKEFINTMFGGATLGAKKAGPDAAEAAAKAGGRNADDAAAAAAQGSAKGAGGAAPSPEAEAAARAAAEAQGGLSPDTVAGMKAKMQEQDLGQAAIEATQGTPPGTFGPADLGTAPRDSAGPDAGLLFNPTRVQDDGALIQLTDEIAERFKPEFEEFTRGIQKLDAIEARSLAMMYNTTPEDVFKMQALNAEQFTRASFTLTNMAKEIKTRAAKAASPAGSEQDMAELALLMEDYAALTMKVKGLQTETARTLSAMRIAKQATREGAAQVSQVVEQFGGMGHNKRLAAILAQLETPEQIAKAVHTARRVGVSDMFWEIYYNSLLSSPQTHVVNFLTSLGAQAMRVPEYVSAYGVGLARNAMMGGEPGMYFGEIVAFATDVGALKRAAAQAWRTAKSGQPSDLASKFDPGIAMSPRINSANLRELGMLKWSQHIAPQLLADGHWTQKGFDLLADYAIRGPQRLMMTADEFNKGLAYYSDMTRAATRQAIQEGAPDAGARVTALLQNDSALMPGASEQAAATALENTFQNKVGFIGKGIQSLVYAEPDFSAPMANVVGRAIQAPIRMTLPFVKTPINVVKYGALRSPIAPLLSEFWEQVGKGGPSADLAVGRLALGTGIAYAAWELAAAGYTTGAGPGDRRLAQRWREQGFQEYSIIIPKESGLGEMMGLKADKNISYKRGDPFSMFLGVAADMADIWGYATDEEQGQLVTLLAAAGMRNLNNRTFLANFGDLMDALGQAEDEKPAALQRYIAQMVTSPAVPAGVAWLGRTIDPAEQVRKDTRSEIAAERAQPGRVPDVADEVLLEALTYGELIINRIKSRAPGLGEGMPDALNYWGEPIVNANGMLLNLLPFYQQDMKFDRAKLESIGMHPTRWSNTRSVDLTPEQWQTYLDAVGPGGEFIRLGWSPGNHPRAIMGVPLTPAEYHDFVQLTNEIRPSDGFFIFGGQPVIDYTGLNLKQAMEALMRSDQYREAPDFPDMKDSKARMISSLAGDYRSEVNFDYRLKVGGAVRLMMNDPGLRRRVQGALLSLTPPDRADEIQELMQQ